MEEPFRVAVVAVQVSVWLMPAFTSGAPTAGFTVIWSEAEQLFTETVNVYVPAVELDGTAAEELNPPGPAQLNATPDVLDEPSRVTEGETQDNVLSDPAFTFGIAFTATVVVPAGLTHPFTVMVTE